MAPYHPGMRLASLQALFPLRRRTRAAAAGDAVDDAPEESVDVRERRLAERLLEDERLRGDLDDATWQPIQDWLLVTAGRLARGTQGLTNRVADERLNLGRRALKETAQVIHAALAADADRSRTGALLGELTPLLVPAVVPARQAPARDARLRQAGERIQAEALNSPAAAACIVAALAAFADAAEPNA